MKNDYKEGCINIIKRELQENKLNIIFGAGINGKILKRLLNSIGIKVEFFVVNDGYKIQSFCDNLKVYELSEIRNINDYNVLNSIVYNNEQVCHILKKRVKKILLLDNRSIFFDIFKIYYENYFINKNIDISKEIIEIGKIKFINPYKIGGQCLEAFLHEIGDLLLPELDEYEDICEGPYEHSNVFLQENDVVIDCGANIGLFSAVAASKNCKVYAFEPMPEAIKYLKKTCNLYEDKIKVFEYALGNENSNKRLFIDHIGDCSIIEKNKFSNFIDISQITIDEFVKRNCIKKVDFIKADIEGAERFMLEGAKETLAKFHPKISICTYHLSDDPEVLENMIRLYNSNYVIDHKWKKIYAYVPSDV